MATGERASPSPLGDEFQTIGVQAAQRPQEEIEGLSPKRF
jgi:hypothetical protein